MVEIRLGNSSVNGAGRISAGPKTELLSFILFRHCRRFCRRRCRQRAGAAPARFFGSGAVFAGQKTELFEVKFVPF